MSDEGKNIKFAAWMAGPIGRLARIAIGAALVVLGVSIGSTGGTIVALVGLAPVGLGMTNRCIIAKAIGAPWNGRDAAEMAAS